MERRDGIKSALAYAFKYPTLLLIYFSISLYYIFNVFWYFTGRSVDFGIALILTLLVSLTIYIMGENRKLLEKFTDMEKRDNQITCHCEEFNKRFSEINNGLSSLGSINEGIQALDKSVYMRLGKMPVSVDVIRDVDEFYKKLGNVESEAKERIWLVHLDPYPPTADVLKTDERANYFDSVNEFAKKHKDVEIKRIIGVSTMEKLAWLDEEIEKTKDIDNISFAYVRADDFGQNEIPSPLTIISCQIIDSDKTFILNPNYNHVPQRGDWKECPPMYYESKEVNAVYSTYYVRLWQSLARDNCTIGCLLKKGKEIEGYKRYRETIEEYIRGQESFKSKKAMEPEIVNLESVPRKKIVDNGTRW